jgi:hypothetical protein
MVIGLTSKWIPNLTSNLLAPKVSILLFAILLSNILMSDAPSLYLLKVLDSFPVSTAKDWLGRIVANFADPRDKYTPSLRHQIKLEKNVDYDDDGGFHDVAQVVESVSSRAGKVEICKIFGLDSSFVTSKQSNLNSPRVWHLKLHNAETILKERILKLEDASRPGTMDGITLSPARQDIKEYRKAWMIVGFLLCDYAAYDTRTSQARNIGGHFDPVRLAECVATPGVDTLMAVDTVGHLQRNPRDHAW